jgi:hypothetical protein
LPACHARRIAPGAPPKKMPDTKTLVSRTIFTIVFAPCGWPSRHPPFSFQQFAPDGALC